MVWHARLVASVLLVVRAKSCKIVVYCGEEYLKARYRALNASEHLASRAETCIEGIWAGTIRNKIEDTRAHREGVASTGDLGWSCLRHPRLYSVRLTRGLPLRHCKELRVHDIPKIYVALVKDVAFPTSNY